MLRRHVACGTTRRGVSSHRSATPLEIACMEEVDVKTWEEFEDRIRELRSHRDAAVEQTSIFISPFLFRGQADKTWRLTTTLERYTGRILSLPEYHSAISRAKPQIETFTGLTWIVPELPQYEDHLRTSRWSPAKGIPAYDYMIYLRHHGFPSPLLDWTRSLYVAAFFAYDKVAKSVEQVSIYVFQEYAGEARIREYDKPNVDTLGQFIRSHRRHFLQQCDYTVCSAKNGAVWCYACHEDVLARNARKQDVFWKFNIPVGERLKVLRILQEHNLNSFSLFASEESLLETLALREFQLDGENL
jgi:hypothetical protein